MQPLAFSADPPSQPDEVLSEGQIITVDGRRFTVRVSGRRKRLGLTVERDGSLTLRAPEGCSAERAESFARGSRRWIEGKVRLQEQHRPRNMVRRFAEGEIFRYLGRDHRLSLVDAPAAPVRMLAGELVLDRTTAADTTAGRRALLDWYCRVGLRWAGGRTQPWAGRMGVPEPAVEVRDIGRRWGVYRPLADSAPGRVALHWAVFQFPPPLIDYVIAHELAHIKVSGHGTDYWRLLRRAIPEASDLKAELDEMGKYVWLGDTES
ncbi:SprT family zinc-dependent metalloprotease [Streptomyces axinellae]|uniref:YgjP-like metallopeptidase domain-containing protein n=1 Tax=Streptomyces axinellae TaxID=552788 RepID=A0ABN3QRH1_9ACTN